MGIYINPKDGRTKEDFLDDYGRVISPEEFARFSFTKEGNGKSPVKVPVVLVQNPYFSAAGVAYDSRERDCFCDPRDIRPKRFYSVYLHDLLDGDVLTEEDQDRLLRHF